MAPQTAFLFGKYAGTPVDNVPVDYLHWALKNMEKLMPETEAMIRGSLARRDVAAAKALPATVPTSRSSSQFPCPACGKALRLTLDDSSR